MRLFFEGMKRVVPAIVILISLSVLGILYTQVQWIRSAMQVRQEQYNRSLETALRQIKTGIQDRFLEEQAYLDVLGGDLYKQQMLAKTFTAQALEPETIQRIIYKNLQDNGIRESFEFAVINVYNFPIVASPGFDSTMISKSIPVSLLPEMYLPGVPDGAEERLFLYLERPSAYGGKLGLMISAAAVLILVVIAAFTLVIRTLIQQRKLSEIKSDFMNNMTHEFKTPLATISLAAAALTNKKVISNEEQIKYYSGMILEENKRMNKQIETILEAAKLEKNEIQLDRVSLDAHAIILKVADMLALRINEREGTLTLHLRAQRAVILADEVHFSNIIFNLIDNAIKYSRPDVPLEVEIDTKSAAKMLVIRISDNGVGMSKETAKRVFDKFYRAHTGNLHNVKGFGLGLSYVKAMIDAHGGRIRIDSTVNKGSRFTITFPLA